MTIDMIRSVLGWTALINYTVFLWWALVFLFAHDWLYRFHGKWFNLSVAAFDAVHYAGMALYKMAIFLFILAPYLALLITA